VPKAEQLFHNTPSPLCLSPNVHVPTAFSLLITSCCVGSGGTKHCELECADRNGTRRDDRKRRWLHHSHVKPEEKIGATSAQTGPLFSELPSSPFPVSHHTMTTAPLLSVHCTLARSMGALMYTLSILHDCSPNSRSMVVAPVATEIASTRTSDSQAAAGRGPRPTMPPNPTRSNTRPTTGAVSKCASRKKTSCSAKR
jgi:hypothetical protein